MGCLDGLQRAGVHKQQVPSRPTSGQLSGPDLRWLIFDAFYLSYCASESLKYCIEYFLGAGVWIEDMKTDCEIPADPFNSTSYNYQDYSKDTCTGACKVMPC
eukprot:763521-Hanusia_phi.AAC.10